MADMADIKIFLGCVTRSIDYQRIQTNPNPSLLVITWEYRTVHQQRICHFLQGI